MNEIQSLAMGSLMGFIFKLIGTLVDAQGKAVQSMLEKQNVADSSADKASARVGGVFVRRTIVITILFALVIVPLMMAFSKEGLTILENKSFLFFEWSTWETLSGYVVLSEVRNTLSAIVGFYFGSSQIN